MKNEYEEMLQEIIEKIIKEMRNTKTIGTEIGFEKRAAYYRALNIIKNTIMEWHPCDSDEKLNKIYKKFGIDIDLDKLL